MSLRKVTGIFILESDEGRRVHVAGRCDVVNLLTELALERSNLDDIKL